MKYTNVCINSSFTLVSIFQVLFFFPRRHLELSKSIDPTLDVQV